MAVVKKAMTKSEIVAELATKFEVPKKQANEMLDYLAEIACRETKKTGSFTIPGIGKLVKQKRSARKGRNPATGEEIKIPAKSVVKMRISKVCRESIVPPKKKK